MSSVAAGSKVTVAVPQGTILTVTAGAAGSAAVDEGTRAPRINVPAGVTRTFGPFEWDRNIGIGGVGDAVTYSLGTGTQSGLRAAVDCATGTVNDLDPGSGWPTNYDRLVLTAVGAAGPVNLTGLKAGTDGQRVLVTNDDATNTITLKAASGSSAAANRFLAHADVALTTGSSALLEYDGTLTNWVVR